MTLYTLESNQFINKPIEEVFQFFSKPENLSVITPAKLGFKILSPNPIKMEVGRLIDYNIYLMGIPIHWRTLITDYEPPNMFVDQQIKGPYAMWHHTHTFKKINDNETLISDTVIYVVPFSFIGSIVHSIYIKRALDNIFYYRAEKIKEIFND